MSDIVEIATEIKEDAVPAQHLPTKLPTSDHVSTKSPEHNKARLSPRKDQQIASTSGHVPRSDNPMVEVQINGKTTQCLVDTGAAVSVLDAKHLLELYDGQPPTLAKSVSKSVKTVSGEDLPVQGIFFVHPLTLQEEITPVSSGS